MCAVFRLLPYLGFYVMTMSPSTMVTITLYSRNGFLFKCFFFLNMNDLHVLQDLQERLDDTFHQGRQQDTTGVSLNLYVLAKIRRKVDTI